MQFFHLTPRWWSEMSSNSLIPITNPESSVGFGSLPLIVFDVYIHDNYISILYWTG
jgi:hypothetical protein